MTLGTLTDSQAQRLAEAGLDYYNHNLDTSPEFYGNIITTPHLPGAPGYAGQSA
ncbi:biotin synthase [Klebsiella pneumoniae]|uniref:Biotin synthase n=1 Tax=Klebsiella pneumoniae TaxID=573 RepID=A0A3S5DI30_KLEPN|nr:biotin synthase [Klebsiella pneumoniae]